MFKETIPCCYFPTKVIIIDDNEEFADNLSIALGEKFHTEQFSSPIAALGYLKKNGELMKTLLTKWVSVSEHYIHSNVTVDVNVASICEEIYNQYVRFDRPVVLVVDYAMPEMNGLQLCNELSGLPYKKIVLTGEADKDFAVEAFNFGKIDRFVKKGEKNYIEKVAEYIQELNISYFNQLSQSMFDLLKSKGHDVFRVEAFISKFNEILLQHNIVEFYLVDEYGSYILLDSKGKAIEFIIRSEEDMQFFAEFAENDGMYDMAEAIAARKTMPGLLSKNDNEDGESELPLAKDWVLCDAKVLRDGEKNYYYAVVESDKYCVEARKKLLSYHQYLYGKS